MGQDSKKNDKSDGSKSDKQSHAKKPYAAPSLRDLGTVRELTRVAPTKGSK